MPKIELPFITNGRVPAEKSLDDDLYQALPEPFRDACQKNKHLADYMSLVPVEEMGVPDFRERISRADGELEKKNLIYPVSEHTFVHVCSVPESDRDMYIPIEPGMTWDLSGLVLDVEGKDRYPFRVHEARDSGFHDREYVFDSRCSIDFVGNLEKLVFVGRVSDHRPWGCRRCAHIPFLPERYLPRQVLRAVGDSSD